MLALAALTMSNIRLWKLCQRHAKKKSPLLNNPGRLSADFEYCSKKTLYKDTFGSVYKPVPFFCSVYKNLSKEIMLPLHSRLLTDAPAANRKLYIYSPGAIGHQSKSDFAELRHCQSNFPKRQRAFLILIFFSSCFFFLSHLLVLLESLWEIIITIIIHP